MPAIHLIKRAEPGLPAIIPVGRGSSVYRSGNWFLPLARAKGLVGGRIFFHQNQRAPAYFGGTIESVEACPEPANAGRIIFTFTADPVCKGVKASGRWSQEMLVVETLEPE